MEMAKAKPHMVLIGAIEMKILVDELTSKSFSNAIREVIGNSFQDASRSP
jgi:hypothetical protein